MELSRRGFAYLGCGSFRRGFRRGNIVIKVPYCHQGFEDNITEAYVYRQFRNNPNEKGFVFAPCRLLPNACLMMPYVSARCVMPDWTFNIDNQQCGEYKGRIVAYDSAYNISQTVIGEALSWAGVSS